MGLVIPMNYVPDFTIAVGRVFYRSEFAYRDSRFQANPGQTSWYFTAGFRAVHKMGAEKKY